VECNYDSQTNTYEYTIHFQTGENPVTGIYIGTLDTDEGNYSNWDLSELNAASLMSDWGWQITNALIDPLDGAYSETGGYATPEFQTSYGIYVSGSSITQDSGSATFSFVNENDSYIADWDMYCTDSHADWAAPISTGAGPVCAPVPEPVTLALFGLGGLMLRRRKA
jgi:hypothetical protein